MCGLQAQINPTAFQSGSSYSVILNGIQVGQSNTIPFRFAYYVYNPYTAEYEFTGAYAYPSVNAANVSNGQATITGLTVQNKAHFYRMADGRYYSDAQNDTDKYRIDISNDISGFCNVFYTVTVFAQINQVQPAGPSNPVGTNNTVPSTSTSTTAGDPNSITAVTTTASGTGQIAPTTSTTTNSQPTGTSPTPPAYTSVFTTPSSSGGGGGGGTVAGTPPANVVSAPFSTGNLAGLSAGSLIIGGGILLLVLSSKRKGKK